MALFGFGRKLFGGSQERLDPQWVRSPTGRFHRFVDLDPEGHGLDKLSGVYVIWHAGVKPKWVYVGRTNNLAGTFHHLGRNEDIMDYDVHGGLYVAWSPIREEFQEGVVRYLHETLKPLVDNRGSYDEDVEPVPVLAPSSGAKSG